MQADLVIVGAGLVGATLALALRHTSLNIVVLEAGSVDQPLISANSAFEPRVSAISLASQALLEHVGAWPAISSCRVSPYQHMAVWDGSGTGHIHFSAARVHQPYLGHIIENQVIQNALMAQLQQTDVQLLPHTSLERLAYEGNHWKITLSSGDVITSPLVVGADGACSQVRACAGVKTCEWDYLHHAIVTSVRCEKPHQKTAWQRFTDTGPLAFLPLSLAGDEHWCSIVWSSPPEMAHQLMALDEAAFRQVLARQFEYTLGDISHVEARYRIALRQRHAYRYTKQGLALIGDAAHVIHPLAGQGVNLGFMDAATLAEVIEHAVNAREAIDSKKVLGRFEHKRKLHNVGMAAAMEAFERLFQADALVVRWLRNKGLDWMNRQDELKAIIMRRALGLEGSLPRMAQWRHD